MFSRVHRKLGTAGFLIAIVALVAALTGGAYAASGGLSGKQKKEVKKIAKSESRKWSKKFAKAGPQGEKGDTGAQGAKGDTGDKGEKGDNGTNGTDGTNGSNGTNGTDGENVTVVPLSVANGSGHCEEGGAKFVNGTGEAYACNAEAGGGSYPETLPAGHSESGFWEIHGEAGAVVADTYVAALISYPLPLETPPGETVVIGASPTPEEEAKCPGSSFAPEATAGVLCLYVGAGEPTFEAGGSQTFGAVVYFAKTDVAFGAWAVVAE